MRQELIESFSADLEALKQKLPYLKGQRRKLVLDKIEEIESMIFFLATHKPKTPKKIVAVINGYTLYE